jgi:glyoxylase-like metal-dependent hydrolase (beta-lactamase superfamily II)
MLKLRKPEILPINDHIWLLDDNHEATCYVVAGRERALIIDTSIGLCNIRQTAEALTSLPLICVNTHGHGDHIGGNWAFGKAFMNLADLPLAKESMNSPEAQEGLKQFGVSYPPFSASSVLIAVSVGIETIRQIEAQMVMRNYKGFLN